MKRGLAGSRRQMNDLDRRVEHDAGCERQDKAVGEKGGVERRERLRRLAAMISDTRPRRDPAARAIASRHRAEPHPGGQAAIGTAPGRSGHRPARDGRRARQAERCEPLAHPAHVGRRAGARGRQQRRLFERLQIEIAPALAAAGRKAQFGEAGHRLLPARGEPVRLAARRARSGRDSRAPRALPENRRSRSSRSPYRCRGGRGNRAHSGVRPRPCASGGQRSP